jgi:hypothetical protein
MISVWKTGSYTLVWQHVEDSERIAKEWPLDRFEEVNIHQAIWIWANCLPDEALKTIAFGTSGPP